MIDNGLELKLENLRSGKVTEGLTLGLRTDEWFRYKQGTLNNILGHSNNCQTHAAIFLFTAWTIKHNIKWLIWSSENENSSLMRKVIEFTNGQLITEMSAQKLQSEYSYWSQFFTFLKTDTLDSVPSLLEKAQEQYDTEKFDAMFIDPYNSLAPDRDLVKGVGMFDYHLECGSRFRKFAEKNKVSLYVAMHPNSESARRKHSGGEYAGLTEPPNEYDVAMGSIFVARADDFYVFHRYIHHATEWMITHIHVSKVKEMETGGRPTPKDDPIRLRSLRNNLGFELDGANIIRKLQSKGTQSEIALESDESNPPF